MSVDAAEKQRQSLDPASKQCETINNDELYNIDPEQAKKVVR